MKSKSMIAELKSQTARTMGVPRVEFAKRISEYCWLYKQVFPGSKNPDAKIPTLFKGDLVFVATDRYMEFIKDLAVLRISLQKKRGNYRWQKQDPTKRTGTKN